ncbi:disulfide oxidoreductase, partial [Bacillus thuringiensis]|nr:disulfide oxidoreductase [Bacillus thuringiensis]
MMCLCNKTSEYTVGTRSGGEEMVNVQVYGT